MTWVNHGAGSHLPHLKNALEYVATNRDTGYVLECGMGYHSTRAFHQFAVEHPNWDVLSVDHDLQWLHKWRDPTSFCPEFRDETPPNHKYVRILNSEGRDDPWRWYGENGPSYDVVLIDCAPAHCRKGLVERFLKTSASIIVVHDTERRVDEQYQWTDDWWNSLDPNIGEPNAMHYIDLPSGASGLDFGSKRWDGGSDTEPGISTTLLFSSNSTMSLFLERYHG